MTNHLSPQKKISMQIRSMRKMAIGAAACLGLVALLFGCKKGLPGGEEPNNDYDFDLILQGGGKAYGSSGLLKFRQNPDTARIADLYTWVHNLRPNNTYLFQRAV